jgi:hypothetical protein
MKMKLNLVREFYNEEGDVIDADVEELCIDGDDLESLVQEFPMCSQSYLREDEELTNVWLTTEVEQNFRTDEVESQSLHFTRGQSKEAKQLWGSMLLKYFQKNK